MNLQPLTTVFAMAVLAASSTGLWWTVQPDRALPRLQEPRDDTTAGLPVVSVPEISRFDAYYVNDHNPFLPFQVAERERRAIVQQRAQPQPRPTPVTVTRADPPPVQEPEPTLQPPVRPPRTVQVYEPPPPPPLPRLAPDANVTPLQIIGLIQMEDAVLLQVIAPRSGRVRMSAGDEVDGYTFVGMNGPLAVFLGPGGVTEELAVGAPSGGADENTGQRLPVNTFSGSGPVSSGGAPSSPGDGGPTNNSGMPQITPELVALYDQAMADGELSRGELMSIVDASPELQAMVERRPQQAQLLMNNPQAAQRLIERMVNRQR